MLNKAQLIGRLTADPEERTTQNGTTVTTFGLATNEKWKDKNGDQQEQTEFHRIVAFGRLAEIMGQYLNKGSLIHLEGKIQTRQWDDKDGNKRWITEIVAREMKMLGGKPNGRQDKQEAPSRKQEQPPYDPNDEVPF